MLYLLKIDEKTDEKWQKYLEKQKIKRGEE